MLGFGGPAGQIALMHRVLVEEKRWIDDARYLHALNFCMLLPGPEAQQLATYVGWLLHGVRGGLIAGILFIVPGAAVILGLSILYVQYAQAPLVAALFFGLKAAVLALVLDAFLRMSRRVLTNGPMVAIAAAAFLGIFVFDVPFPLIVLGAGFVGYFGSRLAPGRFGAAATAPLARADGRRAASPAATVRTALVWLVLWAGPIAVLWSVFGSGHVFAQVAAFFSKMAVVTFGGAYAVLAYVAQQAVENHGWLTLNEMVDGLGLAETTPGPLILVLQFVGFIAGAREAAGFDPLPGGAIAAVITLWVTFVPCFLWIFAGAPYVEALRGRAGPTAALGGITAAVTGVILNLALWFGLHVLFARVGEVRGFGMHLPWPDWTSLDVAALTLFVAALVALVRLRVPLLAVLAASAAAGAALHMVSAA